MTEKSGDVKFIDLLNPTKPRSTKDQTEERMDVCRTCEFFNAKLVKCTKCGCFMSLKTTLKEARCPVGKW